jgi:hypothetical protein
MLILEILLDVAEPFHTIQQRLLLLLLKCVGVVVFATIVVALLLPFIVSIIIGTGSTYNNWLSVVDGV